MSDVQTHFSIASETRESADHAEMTWIAGGTFWMGSDRHYSEEAPEHQVRVDGFWIDHSPVTSRAFAQFVDMTCYVTFAEIPPNPESYPGALPEMLYAGSSVPMKPIERFDMNLYNWWQFLRGADWKHPFAPASSIEGWKCTRSSISRIVTQQRMRNVRERICQLRPSGNLLHGPDWIVHRTRGEKSSIPRAFIWPTRGKANFPGRIFAAMVMRVPLLSRHFLPTAMGFMT
jgi:hypothetical protein